MKQIAECVLINIQIAKFYSNTKFIWLKNILTKSLHESVGFYLPNLKSPV